jgi:hypothetical protein
MCRDLGDGVVPSAGAYVVSSLLPQPGQRAADIAFPDRSDLHDGLRFCLWLVTVWRVSPIQSGDCQGGQLLLHAQDAVPAGDRR